MDLTIPTPMHVVIIISTGARTTGLLVDAVSDIISVAPGAVRPIPDMGQGTRENVLAGLVALNDRMVSLVSLDFLIGTKESRNGADSDMFMQNARKIVSKPCTSPKKSSRPQNPKCRQ
jgi:chemotaxis signal transduction protein